MRIRFRRGTTAAWGTNPVLAAGEPGFDSTTGTVKVGDGTSAWSALGALLGVQGLQVRESGGAARMGVATLTAGTVTVNTTAVTATSRIQLTVQAPGGTVGLPYVSARTPGVSFVITSAVGAADTSTVAWVIIEPAA